MDSLYQQVAYLFKRDASPTLVASVFSDGGHFKDNIRMIFKSVRLRIDYYHYSTSVCSYILCTTGVKLQDY